MATPPESPRAEQEEGEQEPKEVVDPYAFNEKQKSVWDKWQEGKADEEADLDALRETIANDEQISINQVNKVIKCGLYAGDRDDQGRRHGKGKAILPNGDQYDGQYATGLRHGTGKYTFIKGGVYEGDYLNNKRQGSGSMIYKDGSRYDGEWRNDKFNGQGSMLYANGDVYTGSFVDGKRHGFGVYTDKTTGARYEGEWSSSERHGSAVWTLSGSVSYEGIFEHNAPSGRGTFKFVTGENAEPGSYGLRKTEQPAKITFKAPKKDDEEEEEEAPKKKKQPRRKPAPRLPVKDVLRFHGAAWDGVNVYM
eukprot:TRINITY_DN15931_c0_g1_i1.p1 TRINITY_DN15931_c0_g1~~TRINITY_DN15931_c0_g1_i1.p1  ORF type:complete len:332 (-),score=59.72 TRINITY_DN15931_c0_g1_i1:14-937(-)